MCSTPSSAYCESNNCFTVVFRAGSGARSAAPFGSDDILGNLIDYKNVPSTTVPLRLTPFARNDFSCAPRDISTLIKVLGGTRRRRQRLHRKSAAWRVIFNQKLMKEIEKEKKKG